MRGRKPLPRQFKVLSGTLRRDRDRAEIQPAKVSGIPAAPAHLRPAGKKLWRDIAGELVANRALTVLDLGALEIACSTFALYVEASEAVFTDAKGKPRSLAQYLRGRNSQTSPELAAMRGAWQAFKAYLTEFGLTPASRSRLGITPPPKTDDFAEFDNPLQRSLR